LKFRLQVISCQRNRRKKYEGKSWKRAATTGPAKFQDCSKFTENEKMTEHTNRLLVQK
jgi:hypothetical protein